MKKNIVYQFLFILTVAVFAGFQGWRTLFNNFAVEAGNLNGYQMGVVQSVREIPGFLALLVIYLLMLIKERYLAIISVIIMGLGVSLTGLFPHYYGIVLTTLLMSFGFHYFETVNKSISLQAFDHSQAPLIISKLRSVGAATNIVVGVLIFLVGKYLSFQQNFLFFGLVVILLAGYCFRLKLPDTFGEPQKKKLILKKRYSLFYILTLLAGARRQIFIAFAVFLLVKKFELSLTEISALFIINNLIAYFANPLIGKSINKFGERKVLTLEYFSLIFIFLVYAYSGSKVIICLMYILDHLFFNFSTAINTYFQKIGDPADISSSMAVSFTINHLAAVFFPFLGGMLWLVDYKIPFIAGAVLSVVSLIFVQRIKLEKELKKAA